MYAFKTKTRARQQAMILFKKFPKDWKCRIWNNLGWFICFYKPNIPCTVYYDTKDKTFSCLMGYEDGGIPEWGLTPPIKSKDPMKVVTKTLQYAQDVEFERLRKINLIRSAVGKKPFGISLSNDFSMYRTLFSIDSIGKKEYTDAMYDNLVRTSDMMHPTDEIKAFVDIINRLNKRIKSDKEYIKDEGKE